MSTHRYRPRNLQVFLDISTFCNAGCPQGHRTDPNGLGMAKWLNYHQWDFDTFKNTYRLHEQDREDNIWGVFEFCGTWGDPVMNKDIMKMVEYVVEYSNAKIYLDTNASIRDEEWWWDLGIAGGKQLTTYFAIDGIDQKMHSHYRRKTELDKVLKNMKAHSQTLAHTKVKTIVFKHNENYLDDIKDMVFKNGASTIIYTKSDRFYKHSSVFDFIDENGDAQVLEKSTIDKKTWQVNK